MKIDEPKTPYRVAEGEEDSVDQLDAESLAEKLRNVPTRSSFSDFDDDDDNDAEETEEERCKCGCAFCVKRASADREICIAVKRKEFEKRRKAHYNEFDAVRRARLLMQNDDDEDEDDDDKDGDAGDPNADAVDFVERNAGGPSTSNQMDVDSVDVLAKPSTSALVSRIADDV